MFDPAVADSLLAHPNAGSATSFVVSRWADRPGTAYGALYAVANHLADSGPPAFGVELRDPSGRVLCRHEIEKWHACTQNEKAMVARCIQLAYPRGWPVALVLQHHVLDVFNPAVPHSVATPMVDLPRWLRGVERGGWTVDRAQGGIRMSHATGRRQVEGLEVTVSGKGLWLRQSLNGAVVAEAAFAPREVWALDAIATETAASRRLAHVTVYGPNRHFVAQLPRTRKNTAIARSLKYAIGSVLNMEHWKSIR